MSTLHDVVCGLVEQCREPLAKNNWALRVITGDLSPDHARGSCEARPEYREALLTFDFDRILTGDDLQELVVHEMTHCDTWELHTLAEELADALAESAPKHARKALKKLLREKVRQAGERCTTDVGHTYLRLLRRAGVLDTPPENG